LFDDTVLGGSTFTWPVYASYNFIPACKYVEQLPLKKRKSDQNNAWVQAFASLSEDDLVVIVPDYKGPVKHYNPMTQGVSLFSSFANLYESRLDTDMESIKLWLQTFGLPLSHSDQPTPFFYKSLIGPNFHNEAKLAQLFGEYVMSLSTIWSLITEARNLLDDLDSIRGENQAAILSDEDLVLRAANFRRKMEHYMRGTSPILVSSIKDKPSVFDQSWRVSSLWTAMIALFYDSIVKSNPVRRCLQCGKILIATEGRIRYCQDPLEIGSSRSTCQNSKAAKKSRDKQKKEKAAGRT